MTNEVDEMSDGSRGSHTTEVSMADGKGCKCAAHSESECGCDADWTPQEVYDLRAENERLKEAIRRIAEQDATLSVSDGAVTVTMDNALTPVERLAIESAAYWLVKAAESRNDIHTAGYLCDDAAVLRKLLDRLR